MKYLSILLSALFIIGLLVIFIIFPGQINGYAHLAKLESLKIAHSSIAEAEKAIRTALRDPESARFENLVLQNKISPVVCGFVNAKNVFGGYIGNMPFVYSLKNRKTHIADPMTDTFEGELQIVKNSCEIDGSKFKEMDEKIDTPQAEMIGAEEKAAFLKGATILGTPQESNEIPIEKTDNLISLLTKIDIPLREARSISDAFSKKFSTADLHKGQRLRYVFVPAPQQNDPDRKIITEAMIIDGSSVLVAIELDENGDYVATADR